MSDLSKLSKAELIERLKAIESAPVAPTPAAAPVTASLDVTALMTTILAARNAEANPKVENQTYRVENAKVVSLGFECPDTKTGNIKSFSLNNKGDFVMLTQEQIEYLQTRFPVLFNDGYLHVPDLVTMNDNVIPNVDAFVASLPIDEIAARVQRITSASTLWHVFHYLESKRFVTMDEHGNPLTVGTGKDETLTVKEVRLSAKEETTEREVKRRIEELSGVKINLDGK